MALADRMRAARENTPGEMPFLDHLEELRSRIIKSLAAVIIFSIIGFVVVMKYGVLEILMSPVRKAFQDNPDLKLIYLSPADPFWVTLKLGVILGVILAFPIVVYQVWNFFAPALEKHEKRAIVPALYLGLVLFAMGVAMAYFIALPITLRFFLGFQTEFLEAQYEINATLGFVNRLLLGFGGIFELPVVILILSALGLVTPSFLRSKRRHAIVLITIVASFITPGDVITLTVMMMVPLIFLYEFSIGLSALVFRRRLKREAEREAEFSPSSTPPPDSVQL